MEHFLALYLIIGIIVLLACLIWDSHPVKGLTFYGKLRLFCMVIIVWPLPLIILIDEIKSSSKD